MEYSQYVSDFYAYAESHYRRMSDLNIHLKSRLTSKKKRELEDIIDSMQEELSGAQKELSSRVVELNAILDSPRKIDEADEPEISDFEEGDISYSAEDKSI